MKIVRLLSLLFLIPTLLLAAADMPVAQDIGTPIKGVSWTRLHAGETAGGEPSLLITMSQNHGGLFVLDVDLETGHCQQYPVPRPKDSTFSTATYRSLLTGILYIGSTWDGQLYRFDPEQPERGVEHIADLGVGVICPTGITEAPNGDIFIGTADEARLHRYRPSTGELRQYGKMHESEEYLYPIAGDDDTLAALVRVVRPHMVVIDPETGEHREIGIDITDNTDESQFIRFFKGVDRRLYVSSHHGDFVLRGLIASPVKHLPEPMPGVHAAGEHRYQATYTMPGGWQAKLVNDRSGTPRDLLVTNVDPKIPSRRITMDWVGGGSNVHVIEEGPDGYLYGSSYLPNHLYRASLDGSVSEDLGQHSVARGQAYSAAVMDGKVYLASYPQARLSVYDPAQRIRYGTEESDNPRDLGRFDKIGYRPNALIATPQGKLWMGSGPDYGLVGGTLAWYDPATGESGSHRNIVQDQSPTSLLYLPELEQILVGMSIEVGTGADVVGFNAGFALWDPVADELVWEGDLGIEDIADATSLAPAGNGLVYALIGRGDHLLTAGAPYIKPRLALIDPAKRELISISWLPEEFGALSWHGHHSLRVRDDGTVYGATAYAIFRILPGTTDVELVWQRDEPEPRLGVWMTSLSPNAIDIVGPIVGDEMFFATGWRMRKITLPPVE
jgi:hypothetical protein